MSNGGVTQYRVTGASGRVNKDWIDNPTEEEKQFCLPQLRRSQRQLGYNGQFYDLDVELHRQQYMLEKRRIIDNIYAMLMNLAVKRIDYQTLNEELKIITAQSIAHLEYQAQQQANQNKQTS